METRITIMGTIYFEPEDKTKKHKNQASWKKIAMVNIKGDYAEYYSWFIRKRYNLELCKPLRGSHISFINDSIYEIMKKNNLNQKDANKLWEGVKTKWHGKKIPLMLNLDPISDTEYWWLTIAESNVLQAIRDELNIGKPFFDLHMTIGSVNDKNLAHSTYINHLIKNNLA